MLDEKDAIGPGDQGNPFAKDVPVAGGDRRAEVQGTHGHGRGLREDGAAEEKPEPKEESPSGGREGFRGGRLLHLVFAAGGALCGLLFFNFVLMPLFVRHGQEVVVPDLVGRSKQSAEQVLLERSLVPGALVFEHSDFVPRGLVLRQDPPPGFRVKKGRRISLVVSLGRKGLVVPQLAGEALPHARFLLRKERLDLGEIVTVRGGGQDRETVVATSPAAGMHLDEGTKVDLLVSLGPLPVRFLMPDLRGRPLQEARRLLERNGFEVHCSRYWKGNQAKEIVAEQMPRPGFPVEKGSRVDLIAGLAR